MLQGAGGRTWSNGKMKRGYDIHTGQPTGREVQAMHRRAVVLCWIKILRDSLVRGAGPGSQPWITDTAGSDSCAAQQRAPYSITSSARASSVGGTSRPSALAV